MHSNSERGKRQDEKFKLKPNQHPFAIILKECMEPPCAEMKTHPVPWQCDIKSPIAPVTSACCNLLPSARD